MRNLSVSISSSQGHQASRVGSVSRLFSHTVGRSGKHGVEKPHIARAASSANLLASPPGPGALRSVPVELDQGLPSSGSGNAAAAHVELLQQQETAFWGLR